MIGQTLGHYRVVAEIGAGGMGVVYRAHDEQLDRDVALKVLPAGTLENEAARKQFRKEALALARLNHPNIETVFEFSSQDGMDFLAMELIPGTPLSERLKEGPLSEKEVLRFGIQLAEGLAAAHKEGIIHRDLKPGNLFITPDGRLKILDFGLAKIANPQLAGDVTQTITTNADIISGTLPYMSPEQLGGLPLDERSDVYSAGVVLYEMATGHRPFRETQSARLIGAILHQTAAPVSSMNESLSPGLESLISKTLDKDRGHRYQSAVELRAALEGLMMATGSVRAFEKPATPVRRQWSTSTVLAAGAGVCLLLAAGIFVGVKFHAIRNRVTGSHGGAPTSAIHMRRSVAVLKFKNVSGRTDEEWLATALSGMLTTELAAGEELRTVPGESVAEMKISLSLPDADSYGVETLRRIQQNLDADNVVVGSYVPVGKGQIRLDLRLQDTASGDILAAVSERGAEAEIDKLASRAGSELRAKLGVGSLSAAQAQQVKVAESSNPAAEKYYSEGLAELRAFDALHARASLQSAVAADPQFSLAHAALARAWKSLGYDQKAAEEAKKGFDLSAGLQREQRLLVEGQYREMGNEWGKAVEIYRSLFDFFPDNLEYGIQLARAQIRAGNGKEAMDMVASLRRLPSPLGTDSRIDLTAADASASLGDFNQMLSSAQAAANKARAAGAKLALARALYLCSAAGENLGRAKEAAAADDESAAIYQAAGDRNGVASTLEVKANMLADQGNLDGAIANYQQELAIARDVGNKRAEGSTLNNLALVLEQRGDLASARDMYQQAFASFHDIGDKRNSAMALLNIGGIFLEQGDLARARQTYEQALGVSREVGDQNGVALMLSALGTALDAQGNLAQARKMLDEAIAMDLGGGNKVASSDKLLDMGDLLEHSGDLQAARKNYRDALEAANSAGDKSTAAYADFGLGNLAVLRGDFDEAGKDYKQAVATQTELGEKYRAQATQMAIAGLEIEQGRAGQAAASLRPILDDWHKAGRIPDELIARSLLIRAELAQGGTADAKRELDAAAALAARNQNMRARFDLAIANGLIQSALGNRSAAESTLTKVRAEAEQAGFAGYEFESRLALAQLAFKSGHAAAARNELNKLQADAKEKGFDLIAGKAAALQN